MEGYVTPFKQAIYPAQCVWTACILMRLKYDPDSVTPKEMLSMLTDFVDDPLGKEDDTDID